MRGLLAFVESQTQWNISSSLGNVCQRKWSWWCVSKRQHDYQRVFRPLVERQEASRDQTITCTQSKQCGKNQQNWINFCFFSKDFGELAFWSKTKNSLFGALQQVWKGLKGINETFCHSFGAYRGAAEDWGVIRFLFPSVFGQEGGQ